MPRVVVSERNFSIVVHHFNRTILSTYTAQLAMVTIMDQNFLLITMSSKCFLDHNSHGGSRALKSVLRNVKHCITFFREQQFVTVPVSGIFNTGSIVRNRTPR